MSPQYLFNPETGTVTTIPEDAEYVLAELFPQEVEDNHAPS